MVETGLVPSQDSLLALPDELLTQILADVHCAKILWALRLACRRLYRIVEPFLYTSVLLRSRKSCNSFVGPLSSYPKRALHVHVLALHFANDEDIEQALVILILKLMSNLQELSIDSPSRNDETPDEILKWQCSLR
jgi:hypothetical protein